MVGECDYVTPITIDNSHFNSSKKNEICVSTAKKYMQNVVKCGKYSFAKFAKCLYISEAKLAGKLNSIT